MLKGGQHPHPPDRSRRLLAAMGVAGLSLGALAWAAQALPATRMNPQWCYSVVLWLLMWGWAGVDASMLSRSPEHSSRVLAVGVVLQGLACRDDASTRSQAPVARVTVYRACGFAAPIIWLSVAVVHALTAFGVWHLYGTNFRLLTLFGLAAASRCTVIRLVGPDAALADAAESAASAAERIARERARQPPIRQQRRPADRRHSAR
jgi:hypothetical protein